MINYVSFIEPVTIGGDFGAITSWNREKHGHRLRLEEKGSWLVLTLMDRDGEPTAERRRIPVTSVGYISETVTEDKSPKGTKL